MYDDNCYSRADVDFWEERYDDVKDLAIRLTQALSYEILFVGDECRESEAILSEACDVLKIQHLLEDINSGDNHPLAK